MTHEVGHFVGLSHRHDGYDSTTGIDFNVEGATDVAWMGDESATAMSYLPGVYSFDIFDVDNLARWQVVPLPRSRRYRRRRILAHPSNVQADHLLVKADTEFAKALASLHASQWVTAATYAVAGYADIQRADSLLGIRPASKLIALPQTALVPAARNASASAAVDHPPLEGSLTSEPTRPVPTRIRAKVSLNDLALRH